MLIAIVRTAVLAVSLLAGLPWLRSSSAVPQAPRTDAPSTAATSPDRVILLAADSPDYLALAIPKSYKSDRDAPLRLLVFRGGLCIRDRGIGESHETGSGGDRGTVVMEETGVAERAAVASDGRCAAVVSTRYVSRVDLTPGTTSTVNDTVQSVTTLTLVDPAHPEGRWQVTLENGRWVNEMLVLSASMGLAVTTFLPRTGPSDVRILDAAGRETVHVAETSGHTLRIETSPRGGYVAAEMAFPEGLSLWEQGVMIFDLAHGTQWTYGWRYGSDDEPTSWTLNDGGVLAIKLASGTSRFDPKGRRL